MFPLWHEHGFTAEAAWAEVEVVRSPPAPPIAQAATPPSPAQALWSSSQSPLLGIAGEKQAIVDASLARFQAKITQPYNTKEPRCRS